MSAGATGGRSSEAARLCADALSDRHPDFTRTYLLLQVENFNRSASRCRRRPVRIITGLLLALAWPSPLSQEKSSYNPDRPTPAATGEPGPPGRKAAAGTPSARCGRVCRGASTAQSRSARHPLSASAAFPFERFGPRSALHTRRTGLSSTVCLPACPCLPDCLSVCLTAYLCRLHSDSEWREPTNMPGYL
jgi:hypothetical protein